MLISESDRLEQVWQNLKHELNRGALDKKHPFRNVVLGTDANWPNLRYVVLRQVSEALHLLFYTDLRSRKVEEINHNGRSSVLLYHPSKKVQIRMQGHAQVHAADALSAEHWKNIQGAGKKAYGPLVSPGTEIREPAEAHQWPEDIDGNLFAVIEFTPTLMDVLQLNRMSHLRAQFEHKENDWRKCWVAP